MYKIYACAFFYLYVNNKLLFYNNLGSVRELLLKTDRPTTGQTSIQKTNSWDQKFWNAHLECKVCCDIHLHHPSQNAQLYGINETLKKNVQPTIICILQSRLSAGWMKVIYSFLAHTKGMLVGKWALYARPHSHLSKNRYRTVYPHFNTWAAAAHLFALSTCVVLLANTALLQPSIAESFISWGYREVQRGKPLRSHLTAA